MLVRKFFYCSCYLLLMFLTASCGSDAEEAEEARDLAIEKANIYLTDGNCDDAITVIESAGNWPLHAMYLQTKAAAYACRAGFNELIFWGSDLGKITSGTTDFVGSLTSMSTSTMVSSSDQQYSDLQIAINTLLYAGDVVSPSSSNRKLHFSTTEVEDMNFQLLMMLFAQIGKYSFYYGNGDPVAKTKGSTTSANGNGDTNTCFLTYTDAGVVAYLALGATGACTNAANNGHNDLNNGSIPTTEKAKRACQGIVLFNNFYDVLMNTVLTSSTTMTDITASLSSAFNNACAFVANNGICSVKSQSECEADYTYLSVPVQKYFGYIWESFYQ